MRRLPSHMLVPAILLLIAATGADDAATIERRATRVATASVTIIQAERITSARDTTVLRKQDRQIRRRDEKPLIEFY
jgi:hypothetical protein